jgi:hypothetical protein
MTTLTHRTIEIAIGLTLIGYGAYGLYAGQIRGKFRLYTREEQPGSFWTSVILTFGIGLVFLFGLTSWRN